MRPIVFAILLLAAPAVLAAPPPEARAQKEQGDRLRKGGDVDGAIRAYQAALRLDGSYAEAHEGLGELYFATKQTGRAIESFGYAVEIDPSYALAWYNLAFAARRAGDHGKARPAYEKYVKLRPTDADGHYGLAETQRALGNRDAAIAEYQLFIDLAKTTPAQAPWVEKARTAQAELRGGAPGAAATSAAVGAMAATAVPPVPVTVIPPAPVALPPPGPPPVTPAPAAPAPLMPPPVVAAPAPAPPTAAPLTPATPTRALIEKLGAGDRAFLSGDFRPALFAYQDAVYLDPSSAVARIKLARAYAALGHRDQADRQLKQALELDPDNNEARKLMAELANPPPAAPPPVPVVTTIVPAPASAPTPPPSQNVYRLTESAGGPPPGANQAGAGVAVRDTAPPAVPAEPDRQETSRHYRNALTMIGARDFKGAIIELDRALEIDPRMGVAIAARASAFYGLGRYSEAARDYETALVLVPQLATPLYGLAETYRHLNDPRAGEYYARYARSDANDVRPELRETARKRAEQFGAQ
jgi:tetratricopeptide (TPR) repeat protein